MRDGDGQGLTMNINDWARDSGENSPLLKKDPFWGEIENFPICGTPPLSSAHGTFFFFLVGNCRNQENKLRLGIFAVTHDNLEPQTVQDH